MFRKKKMTATIVLITLVVVGVAAVKPPQNKDRNLKVLPQDISDQRLDSIMDSYTVALGVDCKFCHTSFKDLPDSLDFAADDEPMKENARNMIRMNILINKTYFYFDKVQQPEYLNTVNCKTCHRGEPMPRE
jgi:Photosynthetic reaction centre cytochrome C subunit